MKQTNQKIWRISSVLTLILALFVSSTQAQPLQPTITGGRLVVFPQSYQLYPRNLSTNQGTISFVIRMRNGGPFSQLRLIHFKDDNDNQNWFDDPIVSETNRPITGTVVNDSIDIIFPSINILAETKNHAFRLSGVNGVNVTVLVNAIDIVAGDSYIIQGQSNAYAESRGDGNANAEQFRRFVRSYGSGDPRGYSFSIPNWGIADGNVNNIGNYNVGMWGMRLGSELSRIEGIPIAIFNGGYGSDIIYFRKNHPDPGPTPTDGSNNYLRLLKRVTESGCKNNIRAIFWWQGESDILNPTPKNLYINRFNEIHNSWKLDYPNFEKLFLVQVKIGCYTNPASPPINGALDIFQAQLELFRANSNFEIFSTQNLEHIYEIPPMAPSPGWYCHFGYNNGYRKAADLFLPTVRQGLYDLLIANNSKTPYPIAADVTAAVNSIPNQVTVKLNDADDTYSVVPLTGSNLSSYFRLEGGSYAINSISIDGRNIRINFTNNSANIPTAVSYFGRQQFDAPVIENSGGHALVGFSIPIVGGSLPVDPLSLTVSRTGGAHQLRWKAESNERFDQFIVERGETRNSFKPVYEVYGTGQSGTIQYDFTDNKPNATVSHYRIRAIQQDGRELFSQVVTVNNRLNNVKEFRVYPNPVAGSANATINMNEAALATIHLHDASGRLLSSRKLQLQKGNNQFSLGELLDYNPGTYIVRVVTPTETQQIRVVKAK